MGLGKLILGVAVGAAAGALLGVLFAPDKGSATRQKLSKKSEDYITGLKEKFNEFLAGITSEVESAVEKGNTVVEKGKAKFEEAKSSVKEAAQPNYASSSSQRKY